jgi:cell division protein FtsZ
MSLVEVNEASCVIQEAAHEDANIIFGAVIDPELSGRVKITVIATGFERAGRARHLPAAALPTPTDLTSYTTQLARAEAVAAQAPPPVVPHAAAEQPPAFTVARRPALELSLPLIGKAGGAGEAGGSAAGEAGRGEARRAGEAILAGQTHENGLDLSPLDVPAFLRRQN